MQSMIKLELDEAAMMRREQHAQLTFAFKDKKYALDGKYLNTIAISATILGAEEVELNCYTNKGGMGLFKFADVEVLMGLRIEDEK